jgi:hypothetical protein
VRLPIKTVEYLLAEILYESRQCRVIIEDKSTSA